MRVLFSLKIILLFAFSIQIAVAESPLRGDCFQDTLLYDGSSGVQGSTNYRADCRNTSYGQIQTYNHYQGYWNSAPGGPLPYAYGYNYDQVANCVPNTGIYPSGVNANFGSALCMCYNSQPVCTPIVKQPCTAVEAAYGGGAGLYVSTCMNSIYSYNSASSTGCNCKADPSCTSPGPCWVPATNSAATLNNCTAPANGSVSYACDYQPIPGLFSTVANTQQPCGHRYADFSSSCPQTRGYEGCGNISICINGCYTLSAQTCTISCNAGFTLQGNLCLPPSTPAPCAPQVCNKSTTVATNVTPIQCNYTCVSNGSGGSVFVPGGTGASLYQITSGKCMDTVNMMASGKTCTSGSTLTSSDCFFVAGQCPNTQGCCATGAGTPTCTGVGGIPGLNETADPTKCNSNNSTHCCATGAGTPTCTGVGGVAGFNETADSTKCNSTNPTHCCATGAGTPTCTGVGGIPGFNETADSTKCSIPPFTSIIPCCATGAGTPPCTGVGGIAGLNEIADSTKCNSINPTHCCATGAGNPPCTGAGGIAALNETADPTTCSTVVIGSTVNEATIGTSCGTKRISVNPNNTVYSDRSGPSLTIGKAAFYEYLQGSHCACSLKDYPAPTTPGINGSVISQTLPSDTFAKISSQNNSNTVDYSPVAIARDSKEGTVDGRVGTLFNVDKSQCGCPNLNEKYEPLIPNFLNRPQGAKCIPAFEDSHRVLMTYNSSVHENQVIPSTQEPLDLTTSKVVTKIALPIKTGFAKTLPYTRRIWACSTGYVVDTSASPVKCKFDSTLHQCSAGTTDDTASAVSSGVSGNNLSDKFNKTINKKLACCLNSYTKGKQNLKFDCIQSSASADSSFDALWTSKDDDSDGGQLNAVVLSDSKGKPISGFYTLEGSRCSGFSEFGGVLQPQTVKPIRAVTGQIENASGTETLPLPLPTPSGVGYSIFSSKAGFNKVPTSQVDLNRCPILVRAAMKATCGSNEAIPAVQNTITEGVKTRCTAASKISIHVQVMQLTKIAGMAPMKTFDTVADPKSASSIDIGKIVGSKNSGECADGAKRVGSQCVYQ